MHGDVQFDWLIFNHRVGQKKKQTEGEMTHGLKYTGLACAYSSLFLDTSGAPYNPVSN